MSWLNIPVLIDEGARSYIETQTWIGYTAVQTRSRTITITNERWVGGDSTAASKKKAELIVDTDYSDVQTVPASGGQYHVIATKTTEGSWSAWA